MKKFGLVPLSIALLSLGALAAAANAQSTVGTEVPSASGNLTSASATHPQLKLGSTEFAFSPAPTGQAPAGAGTSSSNNVAGSPGSMRPHAELIYQPPTEKIKLRNYLFDSFGPYPVAGAIVLGAIGQAENTPPEWGQGGLAFSERVGSVFGIALVTTTTRYALAEAFREDTIYYRCDCTGIPRRLSHAVISSVTALHGEEGHRRFSIPSLIAPYAGSMAAVYGWYPDRFNFKDGFRMGNYALLAFVGGNVAREFIYGGPHTLFSHLHTSPPTATDTAANAAR